MAEFECKVYRLEIEPHPNADAIELARVGDYYSVVQKGQFKTGDLGVYIPEAAVCPDWLIEELGLTGRLAGKQKNRVKAIRLRGGLSQGLIYPVKVHGLKANGGYIARNGSTENADVLLVDEGNDVTEFLGITKYEPPIPTHMSGEVENQFGKTLHYDIENIKKYPDVFKEGEGVVITEKLHGTWCCFGYHPEVDHILITSKGLSARGLVFKLNEANKDNLYIRAHRESGDDYATITSRLIEMLQDGGALFDATLNTPVYILGEIFGQGVQNDLKYGYATPQFRVFDIYVGEPGEGRYLWPAELIVACDRLGVETVPILYTGAFSKDIVEQYTSGMETVSGNETNIREGVVITPVTERRDLELGRVKLKSVSESYLLRKGKTSDYN